ncbi:MAG TPA: protein kinase [Candidatus Dormibacteraeota bacterium]|jgi:serine/threonine protein kinase/Flp pilus assembly protein TadD|nr:protein kinase [Candidatus Dormibacteraeota bacterium]
MTGERWQEIRNVLEAALQMDPEKRRAYLDQACAADPPLRHEVDSLLAADKEAQSGFLQSPPLAVRLEKGTRLGDYEIQSLLGAGGMGEVYRALDLRLRREVAVKVLPAVVSSDPERLRRFEQEATAAAALNHPNILAVHQLGTYAGTPYLVSELLEGETLREQIRRGRIAPRRVLDYGVQVAHGLAAAHDKGIVHRDLKPENLFVTKDGRAKILDFGLAKLTQAQPGSERSAPTIGSETEPGLVMGTVGYMSPEQVRGQNADHRADIFAFGAILYEMLTGKRAFQKPTSPDTMAAILNEDPPAISQTTPGLSPAMHRIVHRCLEKNPEQRFQSASDLAFALAALTDAPDIINKALEKGDSARKRRIGLAASIGLLAAALLALSSLWVARRWQSKRAAADASGIRSLVVLPLANLSGDREQDYFADGMTEQLTTNLGQISALRVISRTSAMHYKNTNKTLPEIAGELHVDAVVEGSVERVGNQVRITAQLIEASTDRHLWAKSYERDLRSVLSLQDDVAQAIASEVRIKLTPQERGHLTTARLVNPAAHEFYLRGLYELRKGTEEGIEEAIKKFQQAVATDPNEALAYAGLADAYYDQSTILRAPLEVMPKAKAAAIRAIELDDSLAEAHGSLGFVKLLFDWDWAGAEHEFRRALELNPNLPRVHMGYAIYLLTLRRPDEASEEFGRADAIDPFTGQSHMDRAWLLFNVSRFEEAIQAATSAGDDRVVALSSAELGRSEEAIAAADRAVTKTKNPLWVAQIASAYALAGKKDKARALLTSIEAQVRQRYVCGFNVACVYAGLGEKEQAFTWLEKAYRDRSD